MRIHAADMRLVRGEMWERRNYIKFDQRRRGRPRMSFRNIVRDNIQLPEDCDRLNEEDKQTTEAGNRWNDVGYTAYVM